MKKCKRCGSCCGAKTLIAGSTGEEKKMLEMVAKLAGKTPNCKHLNFKLGIPGCSIYENRPWFCRDYYCKQAGGTD